VTTEAVLNLVWALLCFGALSCHLWRERRQAGGRTRTLRLQGMMSVLVAGVALFPVVSASDDRLALADICTATASQSLSLDRGQLHGAAVSTPLEDPEHGQTTAPFFLFVLLVSFFELTAAQTPRLAGYRLHRSLGRAPPCLTAQA